MKLEQTIVRQAAPPLAGLKTGNLFPIRTETENIYPELRRLNRMLTEKGLRLILIRRNRENMLIYLFRPDRLEKDLKACEAECLLKEKGYPCGDMNRCVAKLLRRLAAAPVFPHEIGLFLGYPPSDVRCFMEDPNTGVKCTGCWKAYDHPEEAEKQFRKYHKCTEVYQKVYQKNGSLERLIVDGRRCGGTRPA